MVEIFLEYRNQVYRKSKLIQEKKNKRTVKVDLKLIAEVKDKQQRLDVLRANIQDLREEYPRKKETVATANKAMERG